MLQLSSQVFSPSTTFLFHLLFPALLLWIVHTFFCFSIGPSFHLSFCFNSFLFAVSLYFIVSAGFTLSVNGWIEFPTYHPKLLSSILIYTSQFINPLPLISLLRYTLSISLLRCSTPCIVIIFPVLLPKLFNSSVFHYKIHVLYPITETTQVLTGIILFLPLNFDLNISLNRCR